jgi:hypothetical protein
MKQCECCGGFLVDDGSCPNCQATRPGERPAGRWAKLAVCVALTAGGAMTLAACYGAPCSPGQPGCPGPVDVVQQDQQASDAPAPSDGATRD